MALTKYHQKGHLTHPGKQTIKLFKMKNKYINSKGLTLLILLISLSVMEIFLLVSYIPWRTAIRREMEKELIFRGNQYVEEYIR